MPASETIATVIATSHGCRLAIRCWTAASRASTCARSARRPSIVQPSWLKRISPGPEQPAVIAINVAARPAERMRRAGRTVHLVMGRSDAGDVPVAPRREEPARPATLFGKRTRDPARDQVFHGGVAP